MTGAERIWTCGIVGYGRIGKLYARLLAEDGGRIGLTTTAIADPHCADSASSVRIYSNVEELLCTPVDAVLIATPPKQHASIARQSLTAGKHVLIEKPPAETVPEAQELITLASEKRVTLFFAYHARYNESVQHAKHMFANATIRSITVTYLENALNYHEPNSWVFREGVLKDSGINALSVLTYILPNIDALAVTTADFFTSPSDDVILKAQIGLSLHGTSIGVMLLDWAHRGVEKREIVISTDEGEFTLDIVKDRLLRDGRILTEGVCTGDRMACEYQWLLKDFTEHICERQCSAKTHELELIAAAYRVARTRPIYDN
jgi:D-galactose 1-dehydrogenase